MLKRTAIGIAASLTVLLLIDWGSSFLFVRPCLIEKIVEPSCQQQPRANHNQNRCAYQGGVVTEAVSFIAEWKPETWTAVGTIVIAIFTTVLGLFTVSLARSTRIAANAAKEAADAVSAVERARFFVVVKEHNLSHLVAISRSVGHLSPGENISIKFCFKNYGKTPGILKEQIIGSVIADELPDSFSLPLLLSVKDFPETMIGSADETKSDWFSPHTIPTTPEIAAIARNNIRFWLYGRLYYDDVFGEPQVHCFYFRSNAAANQCVLEPVEPKDHKKST